MYIILYYKFTFYVELYHSKQVGEANTDHVILIDLN